MDTLPTEGTASASRTPLSRSFYERDTREVARALLGQRVVRRLPTGEVLSGIIVETEAYSEDDPASHSFRGPTARNASMFGPAGHAYVYISYGMHAMLNLVCGPAGAGEAVLVRALEPREGLDSIRRLRGAGLPDRQLTNGPGKLAQALGLTRAADDGKDVTDPDSDLLVAADDAAPFEIVTATRIGITQATDLLWRFYIKGNPYVSRR